MPPAATATATHTQLRHVVLYKAECGHNELHALPPHNARAPGLHTLQPYNARVPSCTRFSALWRAGAKAACTITISAASCERGATAIN